MAATSELLPDFGDHLNRPRATARAALPLRTSAMLIPDRPDAVGRFARRPTTDRGHMSSSKALVSERPREPCLLC